MTTGYVFVLVHVSSGCFCVAPNHIFSPICVQPSLHLNLPPTPIPDRMQDPLWMQQTRPGAC